MIREEDLKKEMYLPMTCTKCNEEGIYFTNDPEGNIFLICGNCGYGMVDVWCEKCGIGGPFITNIDKKPTSWQCPECKSQYKLSDDFYLTPQILYQKSQIPKDILKNFDNSKKDKKKAGFNLFGLFSRKLNNERITGQGGTHMNNSKDMPERMDDFFNKRAGGYEAHMKGLDNYSEFYCMVPSAIVPTTEKVKILDLGTGTGLEIEGIFEKVPNAQITCIDMAKKMLDKLQRKYSVYTHQLNIIVGSYLALPFPQNEFDYTIAVQTMHHWLEDTKLQLYQKIQKSLKPGGLYIEADYIVDEQEEKKRLDKYIELQESGVLKEGEIYHIDIPFSVKTQKRLFEEAGFHKTDVIYKKGNGAIFVAEK